MAFGDLTTLADVKAWLQTGQAAFPATDDALLTRLVVAASQYIQTWLNRQISDSSVRATVISIVGQSDAIGQAGGGPALGAIGNVWGIRAALVSGALLLAPAVGLFGRALGRGGAEPELEALPAPADA